VRLKSLHLEEQVHQLVHPNLPSSFPPLKTPSRHPCNLPRQLTRFIGREREMEEVARLLKGNRLVTLTGTGGCGKTRIAVEVGSEVLEDYTDGVWFVDLAPLSAPVLVTQAVASTLGLGVVQQELAGDTPIHGAVTHDSPAHMLERILEYLKDKNLLLIVDNCEHMIAACATLIESLLLGCVGLKALATSRESLNISGEFSWRVPSLPLPDADDGYTVEGLSACESALLFVDRASAMLGGFKLTPENARAVAQICRRLDGIPLAIELAAARMKSLSAGEIASRLDQRFALLTGGRRTALRRQQTLQALVDWSYELLPPKERLLLARLAVFCGGWSLEAAESAYAGEGIEPVEVLDLLMRLVDKSLAIMDEGEGQARYRLLETIRQYAQEKLLASGEAPAVRARHRDWFLQLSEKVEAGFQGSEEVFWIRTIEIELDNVRAAIEWCLVEEGGAEKGLRICAALDAFWFNYGSMIEGLRYLQCLVEKSGSGTSPIRAKALVVAGFLSIRMIGVDAGSSLWDEAFNISKSLGDNRLLADTLAALADAEQMKGNWAGSRRLFEEALSINRETRHAFRIAWTLLNLAILAMKSADFASSRKYLDQSDEVFQSIRNKNGLYNVYATRGNLARYHRDVKTAMENYRKAMELARETGNMAGTAWMLCAIGYILASSGEMEQGKANLEDGLSIFSKQGNNLGIASCLGCLCDVELVMDHLAKAREYAERDISLSRKDGKSWGLVRLAIIEVLGGQYERGRELIEKALPLAGALTEISSSRFHSRYGYLSVKPGQKKEALSLMMQSIDRAGERRIHSPQAVARPLIGISALSAAEQPAQAIRVLAFADTLEPVPQFPEYPFEKDLREKALSTGRASLSPDEYARAWEEGAKMTLKEAITLARQLAERPA
jgi:predicted ATPase/Tfp pilus assembly protein PilF